MDTGSVVTIVFFGVFVAVLLGVLFAPPGGTVSRGLMTLAILLLVGYIAIVFYSATQDGDVFRAAKRIVTGRAGRPRPKHRRGATKRETGAGAASAYIPIPRADEESDASSAGATEPTPRLHVSRRAAHAQVHHDEADEMYDPHAPARRLDSEMVQRYSRRRSRQGRAAHESFARSLNEGRMRADEYLVPIDESSTNLFPN